MLARVFPQTRRVSYRGTPTDSYAFIGGLPLSRKSLPADIDEVHVSCTFTWDLPQAQCLVKAWETLFPGRVKLGGPATGMPGQNFEPGKYLRQGWVITSRGCPNKCWFCSVWKRDGTVRELPIMEGCVVQDDNLLACSQRHVLTVFDMLRRQKLGKPRFNGGLEAARLEQWSAEALYSLRPAAAWFAYDEPKDWEPLVAAAALCHKAGFRNGDRALRCYVLCGYPRDTIEQAERRMLNVLGLHVFPFAMLWRDKDGKRDPEWAHFQRIWTRMPAIGSTYKKFFC